MARDWPQLPKHQNEAEALAVAPEGWVTLQIENIFDKLDIGKRFDQKRSFASGLVPIIDQSADGFVGYHDEDPGVIASKISPVITFANHTCEMRVMRRPFSVIQNVFPMVGKPGICETLFFYYSSKGRVHLEEYKGHYPDFRRLWMNLPPLPEQKAIATVLGALDDKIELNRRMNMTLESMARALFQSWFVDFDPVRAKRDGSQPIGLDPDTAVLFSASFSDSALGHIPKGWETGPILRQADLLSGGTPKTDVPAYWNGDISWASAKDISQCGETFLVDTERTITKQGVEKSSTKIIPAYSTVVVARGATTGRLTMLGHAMAMNQTCYALRSKVDAPFALYCNARHFIERLVQGGHGSIFDTITTSTFDATDVLLAPTEVLLAFDRQVTPLFRQIHANLHQSRTLTTLRDTLLPKLLSGEIRLAF